MASGCYRRGPGPILTRARKSRKAVAGGLCPFLNEPAKYDGGGQPDRLLRRADGAGRKIGFTTWSSAGERPTLYCGQATEPRRRWPAWGPGTQRLRRLQARDEAASRLKAYRVRNRSSGGRLGSYGCAAGAVESTGRSAAGLCGGAGRAAKRAEVMAAWRRTRRMASGSGPR